MGALLRSLDADRFPLGRPETWSESVKAAVNICLNAPLPSLLWLGSDRRVLYNDAFIPFVGEAGHPQALGMPGPEACREIWNAIGPLRDAVREGRTVLVEDALLFVGRQLPREEVYVTLSCGPIVAAEGGGVDGLLCTCAETTEKVVSARRLQTLQDLGEAVAGSRSAEETCAAAAAALRGNRHDLPFAAIYLLDEEGQAVTLVARTWSDGDAIQLPEHCLLTDGAALPACMARARARAICDSHLLMALPEHLGALRAGPWDDEIETALVVPMAGAGDAPISFLVAGVNPRRPLDAPYRNFIRMVAEHVSKALARTAARVEMARALRRAAGVLRDLELAEALLRESETRMSKLVELMPAGVYTCDAEGRITFFNRHAAGLWGREPRLDDDHERFGGAFRMWTMAGLPLKADELPMADAVRKGQPVRNLELVIEQPSGARFVANVNIDPLYDPNGRLSGAINVFTDVTEIKRGEAYQQTLLAELQHRVRNILAVIHSIVSRSDDGDRSSADYVRHLQGRIAALARTQALLARAAGGVGLKEMLREELLSQVASEDQFSVGGPDVQLSPKAAEVLTLAVHELATNATKYGAFSRQSGHLDVQWRVEGRGGQDWLVLRWTESGVPIADAAPRRLGFGAELISQRIPYELNGYGRFELQPDGLCSRIEFPLVARDSIFQPGKVR